MGHPMRIELTRVGLLIYLANHYTTRGAKWQSVSCLCDRITYMGVYIYQPLHTVRMWHKVNFKLSLTGLNSELSFSKTGCLNKAKNRSLPNYLPIGGRRIIGFTPFPRVLVLCEMQTASSSFELVLPCPFSTTLAITPRPPPALWHLKGN